MKALILAAGRGTRIQSVHGKHPKCLIRCNEDGLTILDHQIDSLFSARVTRIGIVVGYEKGKIIQHIIKSYPDRRRSFHFIENPDFANTNNICSFSLAQSWLNEEPFICLNADVVFDTRVLAPAMESRAPITMIVDHKWRSETMKVVISEDRVMRMSKRITEPEFSATYIGITSFSASVQNRLFATVNSLIRKGKQNEFYNVAVQELVDEGLHVGFTSTGDLAWSEIDDPDDLAFARLHVFPRLFSRPIAA